MKNRENIINEEPYTNHLIQLSETYTKLSSEVLEELLIGMIYVFIEAFEACGKDMNPWDVNKGVKKVFASLIGQSLMGFPVKFDGRTLRKDS